MATLPNQYVTVEDYLEREDKALERHEYLNGEIFVMAGAQPNHCIIATNISGLLHSQLTDSDCIVWGPAMLIRTSQSGLYSYADAVVSCGPTKIENRMLLNPCLIVEVLSESTEGYDRGKKFEYYRQIESFTEYLIVAQDRPYVEHHVRSGKTWVMQVFADPALTVALQSIKASLPLSAIYAKVL